MTIRFPPPRSEAIPTKPIPRCPPRPPIKPNPGPNVFHPHQPRSPGPHRNPPMRWPDRFDR